MHEEMRPTPTLEDHDAVRERLQEWLNAGVYAGKSLTIPRLDIPEGTGMSNITLLFDVRWTENGQPQLASLVARLQAQGQKLSFPTYDLPMQFAAMEMLGKVPGIAVPALIAEETTGSLLGVPFYIMKKNDGLIPPDLPPYHLDGWIVGSTPQERKQLWWSGVGMMARVNQLTLKDERVASFASRFNFPRGIGEQLQYWDDYMQWGFEGARNEHCETALEWLKKNVPVNEPMHLCWGDSRMANVIFREDKSDVAALLDWEMLTIGNPLQDIAWWIFMDELFSLGLGCPRLEGFPSRQDTTRYWADKTGIDTNGLHFYLVFAGLRISLILARMSIVRGDNSMLTESFASQYMIKVMNEQA